MTKYQTLINLSWETNLFLLELLHFERAHWSNDGLSTTKQTTPSLLKVTGVFFLK